MKRIVALLAIMLLSFGLSGAVDKVYIHDDLAGDTAWAGVQNALVVAIENGQQWNGMSLGFRAYSPDGATIVWNAIGAYGPTALPKYVDVIGGSRMTPVTTVWDFGFLVAFDPIMGMDGALPDGILLGGVANAGGLPVGGQQDMMKVYFTPGPAGPDVHMLCFDSAKIGDAGDFVFSDVGGGSFAPLIDPAICLPVKTQPNVPPAFTNCPQAAIPVSHCLNGTYDLNATDQEQNPFQFSVVSHNGTGAAVIDATTGALTYTPGLPGDVNNTVTVTVRVADAFGGTNCDVQFAFTNNPPTINCGSGVTKVGGGNKATRTITGADVDICDTKTFALVSGPGTLNTGTGVWEWQTALSDTGLYTVCVSVTDGYAVTECCFDVQVLSSEPFDIVIQKHHGDESTNFKGVLQGHYYDLAITLMKGSESFGGFDFLVSYDASALTFTEAKMGPLLVSRGWEYFTYRFGANGNCNGGCPSGLLRVVGIAETNNGPFHPTLGAMPAGTVLVNLTFLISNNRTFECMYVPVRFFWYDCGDNVLSSVGGDSLFISLGAFDYYGTDGVDGYSEITNNDYGFPGWFGAPTVPCMNGDKVRPFRYINFFNGGFDIVCADSIDDRGDINMNGVKNEIADAVMFTNYFITGLSAFGTHIDASIAASDVNADGIALSVADLVYLIRVIVGDALPYEKPLPASAMTVNTQGNVLSYTATENVGAMLLTFNGTAVPTLNVAGMDMLYGQNGNELRVLVYNIGKNAIPAGTGSLLTLSGDAELVSVEAASYFGGAMNVTVRSLPVNYTLGQNTPNPFNPSTKIALNMPVESDYSVAIYNVAGQLVKEYRGHAAAGTVEVVWDGTDSNNSHVASGIYFYKAIANDFSATKKMVLMK